MIEPENTEATSAAAGQTQPAAGASETQRQRDHLIRLRDHLEQLLCPLLNAIPRSDVETLLAGCGSSELLQFGRPAVAAAVITAMLQTPDYWTRARETIRRACHRGHGQTGDATAQEPAAGLTEQLLARLDFGVAMYQHGRAALNAALPQTQGSTGRTEPEDLRRT